MRAKTKRVVVGAAIFVIAAIIAIEKLDFEFADSESKTSPTSFDETGTSTDLSGQVAQDESEKLSRSLDEELINKDLDSESIEPGIESYLPHVDYSQYVDQAKHGDIVSALMVIEALKYCSNYGGDELPAILRASDLPQSEIDSELLKYERCRPLASLVSNMHAELDEYSEMVAESQHPLFLIRLQEKSTEVRRDRLIAALNYDLPEPYLYARVYREAAEYHGDMSDPQSDYKEHAWLILYCEASLDCDSEEYRKELSERAYRPHEYTEIQNIEKSLRAALAQKNTAALGF